jgi:hypothetical protein
MPDDTATAIDAATAAARIAILAAIDASAPEPVGHGAIRLLDRSDPPPAAPEDEDEPAAVEPQRAGHGTIRLRR